MANPESGRSPVRLVDERLVRIDGARSSPRGANGPSRPRGPLAISKTFADRGTGAASSRARLLVSALPGPSRGRPLCTSQNTARRFCGSIDFLPTAARRCCDTSPRWSDSAVCFGLVARQLHPFGIRPALRSAPDLGGGTAREVLVDASLTKRNGACGGGDDAVLFGIFNR
jgi:hypothetical protein